MRNPVIIYARPKQLMRQGKKVAGWQASFKAKPPGGVTSESREEAVEHMRGVAERNGMTVVDVIVVEK